MKHFCSLSEAIREGAKLRPQAQGLFEEVGAGMIGSCALGAAYEAMTGKTGLLCELHDGVYRATEQAFPYLLGTPISCPEGCEAQNWLQAAIIHLNDDHGWTRERIADFVEKFEESIGFVTLVESESTSSISKYEVAGV